MQYVMFPRSRVCVFFANVANYISRSSRACKHGGPANPRRGPSAPRVNSALSVSSRRSPIPTNSRDANGRDTRINGARSLIVFRHRAPLSIYIYIYVFEGKVRPNCHFFHLFSLPNLSPAVYYSNTHIYILKIYK